PAPDFHQNVLHADAADGRVRAERIRFDEATVALQFGEKILLQMSEGLRTGRAWAEAGLLRYLSEGSFAGEAAGLIRWRRVIRRLRCSGSCGAHKWRLAW